jgi:hypothetical protein
MLPLLAGGVTGGEALRRGLALFNLLFFSLAAGLYTSASEERRGKAVRNAAVLVLAVLILPLCVGRLSPQLKHAGLVSPITPMLAGTDYSYTRGGAQEYWAALLAGHLLGWGLLFTAAFRLRRHIVEAEPPGLARFRALDEIPTSPRSTPGHPVEDTPPIGWLVSRQPGIRAALWTAGALVLLTQTMMFAPMLKFLGTGLPLGFYFPSLVLSCLSGVLIAGAAGRFFAEGRRTGQLEMLLTTPAGAEGIISEQWESLKRLLAWPVGLMLIPVLFRMFQMISLSSRGIPGLSWAYTPVSVALHITDTLLSVAAVCWLAMWFGLRTRSRAAAIGWSVALARGVPYILTMLAHSALTPLARLLGTGGFTYYSWVFVLIPAGILGVFVWLIRAAKRGIARELGRLEAGNLDPETLLSTTGKSLWAKVWSLRHWTPQ